MPPLVFELWAETQDEEHGERAHTADDTVQPFGACRVNPMDILDHQHNGLPSRQAGYNVDECGSHAHLPRLWRTRERRITMGVFNRQQVCDNRASLLRI